jgi:plastocyanin
MRPVITTRTRRLAPAILALGLTLSACAGAAPGWTFAPPPSATPVPSAGASSDLPGTSPGATAGSSAAASPSAGASSAASPSAGASDTASPSAGASGGGGVLLNVKAQNIAFDVTSLTAPADAGFQIKFDNEDQGTQHDVAIKDSSGALKWQGDLITGVDETTYNVPALAAGSYTFVCVVHPNMTGTLDIH